MHHSSTVNTIAGIFLGSCLASIGIQGNAHAATSTTFDFRNAGGVNGNLSSFTRADASTGYSLIATPIGTSLFNSNDNGLCVFSNRSGCGIPGGSTPTGTITGVNFTFNKSVFINSFEISSTNICGTGCTPSSNADFNVVLDGTTSFGPFSFTQGEPSVNSPTFVSTGSFFVAANSPLNFGTQVLTNPDTGFQYRISSLTVSGVPEPVPVPGPLPVLGLYAAFKSSRKIRAKIKSAQLHSRLQNNFA